MRSEALVVRKEFQLIPVTAPSSYRIETSVTTKVLMVLQMDACKHLLLCSSSAGPSNSSEW